MEMKQLLNLLVLLFLINSDAIFAQSPSPAPGPPPTTNITRILEKAGQFSIFMRLLQSTQTSNRINTQLNNSNEQGLTIFAPTDAAFSNLKSITLNSITDQQKSELVQFHIIPSFFSIQQFQTASDPLITEAGGSDYGQFPLNITTSGNSVNISTGFTNATVQNTVYTDNILAVYEVDQVLLPQKFFVTPSPTLAPAPVGKHKNGASLKSDENGQSNSSNRIQVLQKMFQALFSFLALAHILCM